VPGRGLQLLHVGSRQQDQPDAAQIETCQGGCACFANDEEGCKTAGCWWNGMFCDNYPAYDGPVDRGEPSGGGGPASCWNGEFFMECPASAP